MVVLFVLQMAAAWQPPCENPVSLGQGMPSTCLAPREQVVHGTWFTVAVPGGLRWGLCGDGGCLEVRSDGAQPLLAFSVHQAPLQGQLAGVIQVEELARRLEGPMRPCQVETRHDVDWVHCEHDFGDHKAARRLEEGDYYRLVGQRWLGVRYTLSKGATLDRDRLALDTILASLKPLPGALPD